MARDFDQSLITEAINTCTLLGLPAPSYAKALIEIGTERFSVEIARSGVRLLEDVGINASWDFSVTITSDEWESFCAPVPPRGFTSAQGLIATLGAARIQGNREIWARSAAVVDRIFASLRNTQVGVREVSDRAPAPRLGLSPIEGRYITIDIDGNIRRIYFEMAGEGTPVVCLHTAGSDSRQYRHMLEDEKLTSRYRVYAFDLPWHGRSDPPDDWADRRYALTTEDYANTILGFIDTLKLVKPILVGCSIGGAISLYLASTKGEKFAGVCALEGGLGNPGRFVDWTNRLDVDHSVFLTSWVGGLIAPTAPSGPRAQTLWQYAQSGPGVYQGDTHFYSNDLPKISSSLKPASCPLYVITGDYDYSATVEMSQAAATQLGAKMVVMTNRGHFPMSEDPIGCSEYLYPALDEIAEARKNVA